MKYVGLSQWDIGKKLSRYLETSIINLRQYGKPFWPIAKLLKVSGSIYNPAVQKYEMTGLVDMLPRMRRNGKLTRNVEGSCLEIWW